MLPQGRIIGVTLQSDYMSRPDGTVQYMEEQLMVSVLHDEKAEQRDAFFYVIFEPTKMENIASLGKFYGSFGVKGRMYHVFEQLYRES